MIFAALIQAASSLPTEASALETSISALERAISALESDVATLERSLPWEYWVYVFSSVVVVGVAMELLVIRHDWRDEMEEWALGHFGVIRLPAKPSRGKLWLEIWSVLLIVGGIIGETGVGVRVVYIDSRIRAKSAELRSKNAELREKSDQLVGLLNDKAAKLDKEAAAERLAYAKLWEQVGPRTIPHSKILAAQLRQFVPIVDKRIKVFWDMSDPETTLFAMQLERLLADAKLNFSQEIEAMIKSGAFNIRPMLGITITGGPKDEQFIRTLVNGFSPSVRKRVSWKADSVHDSGSVYIKIGRKPPAGFPEDFMPTVVF